jgi:hypothetical protein
MGLMDKVKAQATQVAQKAQGAAQTGQAKLDQVQEKRKVDGLFRDLGAAVYAQRSGSNGAESQAEVERLIQEITTLQTEHASVSDAATPEASDTATPEGGFTLD